jgi:tagaturonate epimerase
VKLEKFTLGVGDRFARQGLAQLQAVLQAHGAGVDVYPVWNKSNREHLIIETKPDDVRAEADRAVAVLGFKGSYYVDADHIGLKTVEAFLAPSDYFTLDVADFIGKPADPEAIEAFARSTHPYIGALTIPGTDQSFELTEILVRAAAAKFLSATEEAGRTYQVIQKGKGRDRFVTEVSMDETDVAQSPLELFLILFMLAQAGVPLQTIAPKFTGRFNKGIDYAGDLAVFEREFEQDLAVIAFAIREFGLPSNLKLSVHSGSDKFSIYPIVNRLIKKHAVGLHVKTAGTTWLEELIGLAEAGGEGLAIVREIYTQAFDRFAELTGIYSTVLDINPSRLPDPKTVLGWTTQQYVAALRHVESSPDYNPHFRQLLHVSFKVAAAMGARFTGALESNAEIVGQNVTDNLYDRHIRPIFG